MLLQSQDADGATGGMSDLQVRDEAITLLLAGHETAANVLAWTWYLLSQNPAAESRLHDEVDDVLAGRLPAVEDLPRLKYTQMVLDEAMRLYPPAWTLARRAVRECEIGGYRIPAKSVLLLSQYVMHRDARYYQDPDRFDPERWTPESRAERPAFSYFPFGGGPRLCIGEQFAKMECTLVTATLAQRWRLRLARGHLIEAAPQLTLRPKYGVWMQIERRHNRNQSVVERREEGRGLDGQAFDQ
jgi:cytochrome P450